MSQRPLKFLLSPVTKANSSCFYCSYSVAVAGCKLNINEMIYCCGWCLQSKCFKFDEAMKNGASCEAAPVNQG